MIKEGIYKDLSNEDYHADKSSISRSAIMDFDKSPYTYWANHLNPNRPKKEKTAAMEIGSALHCLILEPDLFTKQYAIVPPKLLLKDAGREAYDTYKKTIEELEKSNKIILSSEDTQRLMEMQQRLTSNPKIYEILCGGEIENSFFWRDSDSGLMLKARPDILQKNMIVDLKTCSDASPHTYQTEMVKYGYHLQGAMIREAVWNLLEKRIDTVINVCVETKYPYHTSIYIIDESALDEAYKKFKNICIDIKTAKEDNIFCDYGIQTIGLPKWAI
jgi:hypothetical protein